MPEEIYRELAQRLDQTLNGFPTTPSGVELRLLAKIFSPEEAGIAVCMRLTPESADTIASRVSMPVAEATRLLKTMVRKGLVRINRSGRALLFALMPFAVGFYEEQLPRLDREMAELVEQYFLEARGFAQTPIHRVIPVEEAVPFHLEIHPYERASALIESAKSWGVRECICRKQQKLVGKGCDKPAHNCISFAPVEGLFAHGQVTREITKAEALRLLREASDAGLVHTTANHRDGHYYICNCCTCCCGVLRNLTEFKAPAAVVRSGFRATVLPDACTGCGDCLQACPVGALSVPDGTCQVDPLGCLGCGLCVSKCQQGALRLDRLAPADQPPLPTDSQDWMHQRAKERGISLDDIL